MVSVDVVERTLLKIPPYLASGALDELLRGLFALGLT